MTPFQKSLLWILPLLVSLTMCAPEPAKTSPPKDMHGNPLRIAGYIENVALYPGDLRLKAKLDTGALTSSLDAREITTFQKNGKQWVRFAYINADSEKKVFEAEQVEESVVKTHGAITTVRPVVLMEIEIGGERWVTRVNLINRANFTYPLLLGREYLKTAKIVVNPGETFRLSAEKR